MNWRKTLGCSGVLTALLAGGCGCDGPWPTAGTGTEAAAIVTVPATTVGGQTLQDRNSESERVATWRYLGQAIATVRPVGKDRGDADLALFWRLVADALDQLPEDNVALECLLWVQRWTAFLRSCARDRAAGPVTDEQKLRVGIEAALLDQEQKRLVAKYGPRLPKLDPNWATPAKPSPEVTGTFRSSRVGRSQVLTLTAATGISALQVKVNTRPPVSVGGLEAGQSKDLGWVELGHPLQTGDTVEVTARGRRLLSLTVP
jgi:hypothetical protein